MKSTEVQEYASNASSKSSPALARVSSYSKNGGKIFTATRNRGLRVWDAVTYEPFSPLKMPEGTFANYAEGYGARDSETRESLPNTREFNITIDYKPNMGFLHGFWLRLRGAVVETNERSTDLRVIFNYALPVL